jgi:uncharacterized protein YkwD
MNGIERGIIGGLAVVLLVISFQAMAAAVTNTAPVAMEQLSPAAPGNVSPDDIGIAATWYSDYITNTIPVSMTSGQSYDASITFRNSGSGTWTASKKIKLGAKNKVTAIFGPKRVATVGEISPGELSTYHFTLTAAPQSGGDYLLSYQMVKDGRHKVWFGDPYARYVSVTGTWAADSISEDVFSKTNIQRDSYALEGYVRNSRLDGIAGTHSLAMAKSHKLSYNRAGDGTLANRLRTWSGAGESIAFIPAKGVIVPYLIADQVIDKWMNHDAGNDWRNRLNLLDGELNDAKTSNMRGHPKHWDYAGVGAAYGKCKIGGKLVPGWFVTMDFYFLT